MRIFIPLTPLDLLGDLEWARHERLAVAASPTGAETADELELLYDSAMDEASIRSLQLLADQSAAPPCRVVAVAEVAPGQPPADWRDVDSFHLDGPAADPIIEAIRATEDQEEADRLVGQLWDLSLEWFDVTELPALQRRF